MACLHCYNSGEAAGNETKQRRRDRHIPTREREREKKENETLRLLFIVMNGEQQEQYGEK